MADIQCSNNRERIKGEVERTRNEIDSYFNKQKVENLYMLTIVNGISQSRMDVMEKNMIVRCFAVYIQ